MGALGAFSLFSFQSANACRRGYRKLSFACGDGRVQAREPARLLSIKTCAVPPVPGNGRTNTFAIPDSAEIV